MSTPQPTATFVTGHIGLNVSDLTRSSEFYQQVFGFQVLGGSQDESRPFAFLGDEGKLILTLWQQSTGKSATDVPGLHHLAFQVPSMDTVKRVEETLHRLGARFLYDGVVPHSEGAASGGIFFEDPDGIRLEVFTPTGAEGLDAPSDGPSCGLF
jgi:lactoylglutathione lyase